MVRHTHCRLAVDAVHSEAMHDLILADPPPAAGNPVLFATVFDDEHVPISSREAERNAARLVLCWNCHDDLLVALEAFVGYYDQAGIGPCEEGKDDEDIGGSFDGDERFNVRMGRSAIGKAKG